MKISVVLFFCFFVSFSQNFEHQADSLKKILKNDKISYVKEIEILNKLTLYYGEFDFEQAKQLNKRIVALSKKNNYSKGLGFYYQNLANNMMITGDFITAEKQAKKAQVYFKKAKDNNNYILSVYSTCFALDFQGKSKASEKLALATIKKFENQPNSERIVELYYYISTLYNDNKKPKTAFLYINKAAELYRKNNNQNGIFKCNYQLASICLFNGMYEKSIAYLDHFYTISNTIVTSKIEYKIKIHTLYANNYIQLKNYKKALVHCKTFYELAKKENIIPEIKLGMLYFAEIYAHLNQKEQAVKYLNILDTQEHSDYEQFQINAIKGVLYFNQKNFKKSLYYRTLNYKNDPDNKKNLKMLAETEFALKNYKKAYEYLETHLTKEVRHLNEEKNNQVDEYESLYKLKEKDFALQKSNLEASKKEIDLQQQKQYTQLLIVVSIALVFIFTLLVYIFRNKQKSNRLLAVKNEKLLQINQLLSNSNTEKEILLKEIHHRVKNNLQLVMSLLNIQAQDTQNISIQDFLEKGQSRIATMSLIHQNLYQTENFTKINFQEYLENLVDNIKQTFNKKSVAFDIKTNKNSFDIDTAIPLGLIINELVCNALKHAFPSNLEGKIQIQINKNENNTFSLQIGDNGIGTSKVAINSKSIGLELVSLLVLQLKGKLRKLDQLGTNYSIEFKEVFQ